jgi:hypothetical protein
MQSILSMIDFVVKTEEAKYCKREVSFKVMIMEVHCDQLQLVEVFATVELYINNNQARNYSMPLIASDGQTCDPSSAPRSAQSLLAAPTALANGTMFDSNVRSRCNPLRKYVRMPYVEVYHLVIVVHVCTWKTFVYAGDFSLETAMSRYRMERTECFVLHVVHVRNLDQSIWPLYDP